MVFAYKTDTGKQREKNEDCVFADGKVFIVADGMGGHNAGEVASKMAVDSISAGLVSESDNGDIKQALNMAVSIANTLIYECATGDKLGMGTTVDVCVFDKNTAHIGHVGDSRVYYISDGEITKITKDHSYVEMLLSKGAITEKEAEDYPNKNVITRALGVRDEVEMDYYECEVLDGFILMCTDGLTDLVPDEDIYDIVTALDDPQRIVGRLVDLANERGGTDNITVLCIKPDGAEGEDGQ